MRLFDQRRGRNVEDKVALRLKVGVDDGMRFIPS